MNLKKVGDGKVVLIAGGGKIYTDIAARFVASEKPITDIIESPYSKEIVQNIISSGHGAALEFDYFIFGVEGYSRVTETQLVRKRHASYLIKSGRKELNGSRAYNVVIPKKLLSTKVTTSLYDHETDNDVTITLDCENILQLIEDWYNQNQEKKIPEELLRYVKPQGTEFKGIIGMNAHALLDFFKVRCCKNAQQEIRDMANKMLKLCKKNAYDIFKDAGPSCKCLGYCPENRLQHPSCVGKVLVKDQALSLLRKK